MNAATVFFTCLEAIFTCLVAYFTHRLVTATKEYTEVTKNLLEQSKETFEQSRISFLVDIVDKTIEHVENLPKDAFLEQARYIMSKKRTIEKINKK